MKGLPLTFNQTQKLRLNRALEKLEPLSSKVDSCAVVAVADTISVNFDDGVLKGHGTTELNEELVATVCGVVERVNKLVYVRSMRARYKPETGDIVVGRVMEVAQKRWKLDINFSQDAILMLSSMNMPDGIQRRRTADDELNMRSIFEENDVICAEVRSFHPDSSLQLQARSQKYGKLERGQLLMIPSYLVKRRKQHFHHLQQYGIDLILGCNGYIWVGEHVDTKAAVTAIVEEDEKQNPKCNRASIEESVRTHAPLETRQYVCRTANSVRVLTSLGFCVTMEVIVEIVNLSCSLNVDVQDMLGAEFCVLVAEMEGERRSSVTKRK